MKKLCLLICLLLCVASCYGGKLLKNPEFVYTGEQSKSHMVGTVFIDGFDESDMAPESLQEHWNLAKCDIHARHIIGKIWKVTGTEIESFRAASENVRLLGPYYWCKDW